MYVVDVENVAEKRNVFLLSNAAKIQEICTLYAPNKKRHSQINVSV